jgi:hypothetical protein
MIKTKGILAIGIILLFIGLAFSPATAQTTIKDRLKDFTSLQLSESEITSMEKFLPTLIEKMQTATSYSELIDIIQNFMKENGRHPILTLLLTICMKMINFNFNFNQLRPVRKTAFVMSMGYTNKLLSFGKNKINIAKPMTTWFYTGRSNVVLNSRTIIVDPYPFSIKKLDGRQVGLMTNFIGFYIHFSGSITDKAKTFFFGYASTIRGFDLSPMHN